MAKTKILITDDHVMIRETWSQLLNSCPGFDVVAIAGTGEEAIDIVKNVRPDIVLMDISLPGISGIVATQIIRLIAPGTKVIAMSLHTELHYVCDMMETGACGYITKDVSLQEADMAIKSVLINQTYICDTVNIFRESPQSCLHSKLPKREFQVMDLERQGYSTAEIALRLNVCSTTIESYRANALKRLNLKDGRALLKLFNKRNPTDLN